MRSASSAAWPPAPSEPVCGMLMPTLIGPLCPIAKREKVVDATAAPASAAPALITLRLDCFMSSLPPLRPIVINLEQPGRIATNDFAFIKRRQLRLLDESHRVVHPHVEGVVGTQYNVVGAIAVDQVVQHLRVEHDGVEIELLEVGGRLALDHGPAVGARFPGVVHALPVMGKVAAAVRQQDLELRVAI